MHANHYSGKKIRRTALLFLTITIFIVAGIQTPLHQASAAGNETYSQSKIIVPQVIYNATKVVFTVTPIYDNGTLVGNFTLGFKVNETTTGLDDSPVGYGEFSHPGIEPSSDARIEFFVNNNETGSANVEYTAPIMDIETDVELRLYMTLNGTYFANETFVVTTQKATDISLSRIIAPATVGSGAIVEIQVIAETAQNDPLLDTVQVELETTQGTLSYGGTQGSSIVVNLSGDYSENVNFEAPTVSTPTDIKINATFTLYDYYKLKDSATITVVPPDYSTSTMQVNATAVQPEDFVKAVVTVLNSNSPVAGVTVSFATSGGAFTTPNNVVSNSEGKAEIIWQAPLVTKTISFWINASIGGAGAQTITLSKEIVVTPETYNVTIFTNASVIEQNETVEITVFVGLETGPVDGVPVSVQTDQGEFSNGLTSISGVTNSQGAFTVQWIASFEPFPISGSDVLFYVEVDDGVLAPVQKTFEIHVNPVSVSYEVSVQTSQDTMYVNETLTLTIRVTKDGQALENATIRIDSGVGEFENHAPDTPEIAYAITNSSGYAVFVWKPTGLSNPPEPKTITFSLRISILEEEPVLIETNTTVSIIPYGWEEQNQQPSSDNTGEQGQNPIQNAIDNADPTTIGTIIALVIISGGVGYIVYFFRRR